MAFNGAIIITQISCRKEVSAQADPNQGLKQLNLLLYTKEANQYAPNSGDVEYWLANIDGSNQRKLPISITGHLKLTSNAKLTPDGKTIIFGVRTDDYKRYYLYSCSIDGSNLKKLVDGATQSDIIIEAKGAY